MSRKPSQLLDPADRLRIERTVLEMESATSGEIVVVVVRDCNAYAGAPWRLAVALAALAYLLIMLFAPPVPLHWLLAAQAGALVLGHGLARIDPVRRWLVGEAALEEAAKLRARVAFGALGLTRTVGRTGILILVALFEHRVIVLGDEGVNRVLDPDESWDQVVQAILSGLREGRPVEGILAGVRRCGEILARHLPAPPRNLDELPRALVLED